ncbi:conjugal transfer protein MobB [uncultured Polaribacter sp.]|uniref:conjugal transfer protein MobB n=1 Tax=uncultured Polaribacter sp. TaxID=174711 RepID=UPI00261BF7F6|nr:conjugal transfer protein MobB [uncultured Polaribacter sp.]
MVAKIGRGNNLIGALIYNHKKVEKGKGNILHGHKMIEPLGERFTISLLEQSFKPYLIANKRTEKPILHISLNPSPKDEVSDELFQQLSENYMNEMGYRNQPYVVFKHTDIDRAHIHIVSVCVDETGKRISDSFEKRRSMKVCRALEKQFDLSPAVASKKKEAIPLQKVDITQANLKRQIASVLTFVNEYYHFQTFGEYKALLSFFNVTAQEVRGEIHGKEKKGLVYFAIDDLGKKGSHPLPSSRFPQPVSLADVHRKMEKSKIFVQQHKPQKRLRGLVTQAIQNAQTQADFRSYLQEHKVSLFVRENDKGRIYGVSFIDHASKTVLNGSRLGKAFSANVFHRWWKEGESPILIADNIKDPPTELIQEEPIAEADSFSNAHSWEALSLLPMDIPLENDEDIIKKKRKKKKNAKRR